MSADALQVYAGLEIADRRGRRRRASGARAPAAVVPPGRRDASAPGSTRSWRTPRSTGCWPPRRRPIVVGGTGLYLRAALTELSLRPPPPEGVRERWLGELERRGPPALHATLAERAPWAAAEIEPGDRQRIVRALELLDAGELEPPEGESELWTDDVRRPTLLVGLVMEREQLYARIDARVDADGRRRRRRRRSRRANAAGASITARKALGFDELLAGDVEAMKRRTRNYARRQLTWMRKLAGGPRDRRDRARPRRRRRGDRAAVAQGSGVNGYISDGRHDHREGPRRDRPARHAAAGDQVRDRPDRCPGITITM